MKRIFTILATGAALTAPHQAVLAEPTPTDGRDDPRSPATYDKARNPQDPFARDEQARLGRVSKASDVIGMEVENLQNEKLGKVVDLAVDLQTGRVLQVVVSSGGFLGIARKTLAVPPRSFSSDGSKKVLQLDLDKERFKAAPSFDVSRWSECCETQKVMEVYRYYRQEPYFMAMYHEKATPGGSATRLGISEKASKLIGMSVRNPEEEKVGKVDDLLLDLDNGRVVQVVISTGGFLGLGDTLSLVPPTAFHYDVDKSVLHLATTKEALTQAPHFKSKEWPRLEDSHYMSGVYRSYRVDPYFRPDADNTGRNVRDRGNTLTPLDQGGSDGDVAITRRIRKEIQAQEGLSINARNIKVITVNGRVTLRGPVNSNEEKRMLTDLANRIAVVGNVDDQLEVKGEGKNP